MRLPDSHHGGYQLMISADIFRGAIAKAWRLRNLSQLINLCSIAFALPTANHVFLPGHRIMVQIQSSWFPLTIAIRQTLYPIFSGPSRGIFAGSTAGLSRSGQASFIELPLVTTP